MNRSRNRVILRVVFVLGLALLLVAIALGVVAIWTVGPNSDRFAGTAMLLGFVGGLSALIAGLIQADGY